MSHKPKSGLYAVIPSYVRRCKELEPNAKLLYADITALAEEEGYCWATNEHFAELFEVDVRTIQRWLKSLKEQKFITIDNPSNFDEDRQRKIWPNGDFKKMFTERHNRQGGMTEPSSTPNINNTTNKNTPIIPTGESSFHSKKRKKIIETPIEKVDRVWITPSQHDNLLKRANQDTALVESWYQRLSQWKVAESIAGGNDFKSMGKWVIEAVERDKTKIKSAEPPPVNAALPVVKDKKETQYLSFVKNFHDRFKMRRVDVGNKRIVVFDHCVEFIPDMTRPELNETYKIQDPNFKENILQKMKNWGVNVEGL